jgi:hypothetical protein
LHRHDGNEHQVHGLGERTLGEQAGEQRRPHLTLRPVAARGLPLVRQRWRQKQRSPLRRPVQGALRTGVVVHVMSVRMLV